MPEHDDAGSNLYRDNAKGAPDALPSVVWPEAETPVVATEPASVAAPVETSADPLVDPLAEPVA